MSYLPATKFGSCANPECGATNTEVVKVGKNTYCLNCRNSQKTKVQLQKANERNKVRSLNQKQVQSGNYEDASRSALILDLDTVTSRICRLQAADSRGLVKCISCPKIGHFSLFDAGHFISRSHMGLRWDLKNNIRPQCRTCNQQNHGNLKEYEKELELEYPGLPERLKEQAKEVNKPSIDEMKQMLFDRRILLRKLEEKLKDAQPIN